MGRIENTLQGLPPPYRLNRPGMYVVTSSEQRHPCKAPTFSVNWINGTEAPEVVNTITGKPEAGDGISQVCKYNLMKKFLHLCGKLESITNVEEFIPTVYSEAKERAKAYMVRRFSGQSWHTGMLRNTFFNLTVGKATAVCCIQQSGVGSLDRKANRTGPIRSCACARWYGLNYVVIISTDCVVI